MSDPFETVATYWDPMEARLAKHRLDAVGIPAFLKGEEVVSMNWLLTNALGGIQLQVAVEDAARAQATLEEIVSADDDVSAVAAGVVDSQAGDADWQTDPANQPDDEAEPPPNLREQNADRAWRGAIIGVLLMPMQLYMLYLLLKVFISDEELRDKYRRRAWLAAAINVPIVLFICIWIVAMLKS